MEHEVHGKRIVASRLAVGEEDTQSSLNFSIQINSSMQPIKMVDLSGQYLAIKQDIDQAIQSVLTSTAFIQGPQVNEFAEALSAYTGSQYVIPCGNGTDALQIAMMALDSKPGDEVILPVHTYVATAEVIALLGLIPVFVDVDPLTFNIDVNGLEKKITSKTKAIVPVHLYGQCADMEPLLAIASKYNVNLVEDAAQALGATYTFSNGTQKQAGTIGHIGTTSFFPSKNLGAYGDGGAVFTQRQLLADKARMIANHGQRVKYEHEIVGINSRLDTLQAAILQVKLKYLDSYTKKRNRVAQLYDQFLANSKLVEIPARAPFSTHVFHQYTVKVRDNQRDNLKKYLQQKGIPSMIYYPVPLHLQEAYKRPLYPMGSFPVTEHLSKCVLSLPIHTELTESEIHYICETLQNFS